MFWSVAAEWVIFLVKAAPDADMGELVGLVRRAALAGAKVTRLRGVDFDEAAIGGNGAGERRLAVLKGGVWGAVLRCLGVEA